ncbi:MAG: LysM peptidoglycan-binding domain-containing protein [Bacteroidota bacterium]
MRNFFLTLSLFGFFIPAYAAQYFVLFDASCMERLEYEQAISQQPRMPYFAYQIQLAGDQYLTLETGVEGAVTQDYLPQGYLGCNSPVLNAELADRINGNMDRVFMLISDGSGTYLVQPVAMATLRSTSNNMLNYESPLAHFNFDTDNGIIGENLAINNPGARVYFEGRDNAACTSIYLFRQLMPRNAYPVIDYKLSSELGVVERRLGSDGNSTLGGVISLRKINGQPLNSYLANWCSQMQTQVANTTTSQPQIYYGTPTIPTPTNTLPAQTTPVTPATNTPTVVNTQVVPSTTKHTVTKGQTLYALSRQYDTSVDQIKQWNGLSSNEIFVGQQLIVGETVAQPTTFSNNVVTIGSSVPGRVTDPAEVQNINTRQPGTLTNTTPSTQQYYVVQPGETVASVALRLGYTEARFREINDLGALEVVRVGQRLKANDCNCPDNQTQTTTANRQPSSTTIQPGMTTANPPAAPTTFSQQPRIGAPQSTTTATQAPAQNFSNSPNFGTIIPEAYQPTRSSMADLENRANTAAPNTYNNANPYGNTNYSTPQTYNNPNQQRATHVVQEGESLYSIATRYNLSVDQLRQLNGMSATDIIIPFQRLFVN